MVGADVRANYLCSPPLVVAYAIAGSINVDLSKDPLGIDKNGKEVFLRDIWPNSREIDSVIRTCINNEAFAKVYTNPIKDQARWDEIPIKDELTYAWDSRSTYLKSPPFFDNISEEPQVIRDIIKARILGLFLDSITTDHISPVGSIKEASPAGEYLRNHQVAPKSFNQYGARRGNHEVLVRGTFANIRIKNQIVPNVEGGVTIHYPSKQKMSFYDAAMMYKADGTPLIVFAGKEYGAGSARDWAAKGSALLGIRAVVAQSFERIHRSNLIGMGVLPLCFEEGTSWRSLGLSGDESITIRGLCGEIEPRQFVTAEITTTDRKLSCVPLICRLDTAEEVDYYKGSSKNMNFCVAS